MVGVQGSQGVRDQLRRCKPGNRAHLDPLSQAVRGPGLPSVSLWELVTPAAVWTPVPGGPPGGAARAWRPPRPLPLGTAWPRGARPRPPCRPRGPRTHTPEPPSSGPVQDARPLSVQGGRITDVGRRGARAAGGASPSEARGLGCSPRRLSRPGGTASSAWSGLRTRCPRDGRGCARGSFQRCRDVVRGPYTWDVFQVLSQGVRGNALQTRVGLRRPLAATRPWPGRHAPGLRGPSWPRTRATGRGHTGSARPPRFSPQTSSEQVPRPRCLGPHFLLFCAFCW